MRYLFRQLLTAGAATAFVGTAAAQELPSLSVGHYRLDGSCSKTVYLGSESPPACDGYLGLKVENPSKPMFIFPLKRGAEAWFFVTSGVTISNKERVIYAVEKLYDRALNAEFTYPAGECEITAGPTVRCTLWKNTERTVVGRELVFSSNGRWLHQK